MQYVFVYGTLRAGEINDINVAAARYDIAAPTLVGEAFVRGRLFDFGAYPGLVVEQVGDRALRVKGDVYEIDDALVAVLDEIEEVYPGVEGLFLARHTEVEVNGVALTCRFYPVAPDSARGWPEIRNGDWVTYRRAR
ncbi:gamma-glutamylcyclotransferase family protein [Paraburkholderia kururiensis]|uniref:Gamma-glutamylcyclotransferase family protein n=1 Tax=Paraburkholderia kururiensis TaxID=984307 RepID=A0ABZ0WQX8_9BURK|nr:gamma-glutamylcyclotransferase family protein [Paraburkholderia kururiensis]WQD79794.1 gamma-glutamylcyclotransferase family protein [Paraburkholderia kururiensis]